MIQVWIFFPQFLEIWFIFRDNEDIFFYEKHIIFVYICHNYIDYNDVILIF